MKKFIFLTKLRLKTDKLLKMNSFADILLRFEIFAFNVWNSKSTYYVGHISVAASEQKNKTFELRFPFIQDQQYL